MFKRVVHADLYLTLYMKYVDS